MSFVLSDSDALDVVASSGGQLATSLHRLRAAGIPVPDWLVISASSLQRFLKGYVIEEDLARLTADLATAGGELLNEQLKRLAETSARRICGCSVSPEISRALELALEQKKLSRAALVLRVSPSETPLADLAPADAFFHPRVLMNNDRVERLIALREVWASAFAVSSVRARVGRGEPAWPYHFGVVFHRHQSARLTGALETDGRANVQVIHRPPPAGGAGTELPTAAEIESISEHARAYEAACGSAQKMEWMIGTDSQLLFLGASAVAKSANGLLSATSSKQAKIG